jgi:hypothetical protein
MRFYAQNRFVRISLPLLNLALCVAQSVTAVRRPTMEHVVMAVCWGLITLLNGMTFWGTYWKVTPEGLLENRGFFARRLIPYDVIQDVSADGRWGVNRIRISVLLDKPVSAVPFDYAGFVGELERHVDAGVIHV